MGSCLLEQEDIILQPKNSRQKVFLEKVNNCIENKFELFSFDVFDTLITRTTFYPSGIFLLMQEELKRNPDYSDIPEFLRNNFRNIRYGAEGFLNSTRESACMDRTFMEQEVQQEFSQEDFYQLISKNNPLSQDQMKRLIELEFEIEMKNSLPIEENIEILKYLISKNQKVVLISDMYLKEYQIRDLLLKHDEIFRNIPIYVSSEYQKNKGTGSLFHIVAKNENVKNYNKWLHVGDNEEVDIKSAQKINIKTHYFPKENRTEFEKNFYTNLTMTSLSEAQLLLGTSVNTRRFLPDNKWADFATIATAIFYPYVKWLIEKSLNEGINRLYFIARDGYVLKEIADIIIEQGGIKNLETHYIYGSRQAWRAAAAETFEDFAVIFERFNKTISIIAYKFNIELKDLQKFLTGFKANQILTIDDLSNIRNLLSNNSEFLELLKEKNKEQKELLIEYLRQNIDFSDENFAFVDLTGSGATINLLSDLIKRNFNVKSKGFVISLFQNIKNDNFIFYDYIELFYYAVIIEMIGRAPHGQTIKYKKDNDKVIPVLDNSEQFMYFDDYINAIKYQTKQLNEVITNNHCKNLDNLSYVLMTEINRQQTSDIANYFCAVDFSPLGTAKMDKLDKNALNILDILNIYFFQTKHTDKCLIKFTQKNNDILTNKLIKFFENNPKFNMQFIMKSMKDSKNAIKHSIWRRL